MTDYNPDDYTLIPGDHVIAIWCRHCTGPIHDPNGSGVVNLDADTTPLPIDAPSGTAAAHHRQYHAPPQCPAVSSPHLGGDQCDDVPDHYGVHTHLRTWWENHDYPAGVGPCTTDRCTKYNGHPGDHHQRPEPGPSPYSEEPPW